MNSAVYEALAFAMRYWFIIAMAVILIAVILISVREYKSRRQAMERVRAFNGYLEIVAGPEDMTGEKFGMTDENLVGGISECDIWLDDESVYDRHAVIFRKGGGLFVKPFGRAEVYVNDELTDRATEIGTGDIIGIGDIDLCVFLKRKRVGNDY